MTRQQPQRETVGGLTPHPRTVTNRATDHKTGLTWPELLTFVQDVLRADLEPDSIQLRVQPSVTGKIIELRAGGLELKP